MAILTLLLAAILSGCTSTEQTPADQGPIRFGTLPVLQALELYVAESQEFFQEAGVQVELIDFSGAAEKDIALAAGQLDGYFGDLFTPVAQRANGIDLTIVATNYTTRADRRMFGVLAGPQSDVQSLRDLAEIPVAISSNSVIHYVTEELFRLEGGDVTQLATIESKNIGLRMQMLMSGQVEAATLPEPLLTAAQAGGARLLADDHALPMSQTVLAFHSEVLKRNPQAVRQFLSAVDRAGQWIEANPDSARSIMVSRVRLPEPLRASHPIPKFPALEVPAEAHVLAAADWLRLKKAIPEPSSLETAVDGSFIPQ